VKKLNYFHFFFQIKVEHSGGNADFAEYMEVVNEKEAKLMTPGSIVNLHEGRCTVNHFESPGCLPRIVSTQPLIVGNVQAESTTYLFLTS